MRRVSQNINRGVLETRLRLRDGFHPVEKGFELLCSFYFFLFSFHSEMKPKLSIISQNVSLWVGLIIDDDGMRQGGYEQSDR